MSRRNPVRTAPRYVAEVDEGGLGAVDAVRVSERESNLWLDAWRDVRRQWMFWVSLVLIVFIVFVALFPTVFTDYPPNDQCFLANSDGPPQSGHLLGFTKQGCDVLSRIVHGTSTSLSRSCSVGPSESPKLAGTRRRPTKSTGISKYLGAAPTS